MPGLRNIKAAERHIVTVTDPAEQQWLELILFQLLAHEARRPSEVMYVYDCDALYVIHAMQALWRRPTVLAETVQGILRDDWPRPDEL